MDIENFTSKLLLEYSEKIQNCSELLTPLRFENRKQRRDGKTVDERMGVISQIRVIEAQRQAYIQAQADIESIQDHLGI